MIDELQERYKHCLCALPLQMRAEKERFAREADRYQDEAAQLKAELGKSMKVRDVDCELWHCV